MNQLTKGAATAAEPNWGEPAGPGWNGLFQGRRVGKFEPPFYGFRLVSNGKIADDLASCAVPKLTTVSAPTGYGKTTFMTRLHREWAAAGHDCVWVSLDESDRTVAALLDLLHRAVAFALPTADNARTVDWQAMSCHLDGLLRQLLSLKDTVLFIDNLHLCPDPGLGNLLDALIFATGGALRLVLASSVELPLDATRARLELTAIEIGPKQLVFDATAVGAVFADAGMAVPRPATMHLILEKTEGWPAAVRLIQTLMSEEPDSEAALRRFAGSDADLAAMLNTRLFASFDADLVDFLLDLAHLRIFSIELATVATRHPRAAEWIRYLVQRNALISALDRHRIWFRFHALFRDFLLAESARRKSVSQRAALLERAATWCFANGHGGDAANYALAAPAPALVVEILESSSRGIVSERGDLSTFMGWMARAHELGVEVGLESEFWYAWALTFSRRNARARLQASRFERRLLAEPADAPKVADLLRRQELLKMMLSLVSDDMDAAYRVAAGWLKAEKPSSPIYTLTAALAAATSLLPEQNYTQVRRNLQIAQAVIGQISGGHSRAWMAVTQALLDLEQGNPASAEHILMAAQQQVIDLIGPNVRMVAMLAMLRARAIFDMGRLEEARSILQDCLTMGAAHGFVETTRHGLEAATALSNGENAGPLGLPALAAIANNGPPRLRRTFMAAQIRRLCMLGEAGAAQELADDAEIAWNETGADYLPSEALAITLARIDLMSVHGRIKQAQKLAEQTLREVTTLDRRREMVDLHLTIARLHMLTNDQKSAIRSLSRALALAAPRALVAPFLQHQRVLKEILAIARLKDLALTLTEQLKFFRLICEKTGATADAASCAPGTSGEIEALTKREIEMLALLEAGPSNQQIADQLLVSLQTVKWHLYNLYAKLGVRNRAAALAKARSLNLLTHQMP